MTFDVKIVDRRLHGRMLSALPQKITLARQRKLQHLVQSPAIVRRVKSVDAHQNLEPVFPPSTPHIHIGALPHNLVEGGTGTDPYAQLLFYHPTGVRFNENTFSFWSCP